MAIIHTNLKDAALHLQARYASLSTYGQALASIFRSAGAVPPLVLGAYKRAVTDYLRFGKDLFDILDKKGISVEQVVYSQGKPVVDPHHPDRYRTLKINAPLRPPTFTGMSGELEGSDVGAAPLLVGLYIVGGIIFTSLAGYFTIKSLEQIRIIIQGPDYEPDRQVDAYLKSYKRLIESGMSPKEAAELSRDITKPPPSKPGTGWLGPIAAGALAATAAVMIFGKRREGSSRPHYLRLT